MIPILYKADETNFSHGGLGTLADTISCFVIEERNGAFELTMEYPVNGLHYGEIKEQRILKAKADDQREPQYFCIYKITTPMSRKVTIYAEHITYKLSGNFVTGFRSTGTPTSIMNQAFSQAIFPNRFSFRSDISSTSTVEFDTPVSLSQIMGGTEGSILRKWTQGEYERDNETVRFLTNRGQNNGVLIAYGKNLTDIKQEISIAATYTHIIPYAKVDNGESQTTIYSNPKAVPSEYANNYAFNNAYPVDFSNQFESGEVPTAEKLLQLAKEYIQTNHVGKPSVNLTVKWIPLDQMNEYKNNRVLERVSLCDTVTVKFEEIGISQEAKVIKIKYNTLKERIEEAQIGDAKSNFADTFQQTLQKVEDVPQNIQSTLNAAIKRNTDLITGVKGGHVYFKRDAEGKPQEIYIMDKETVEESTRIWRWNVNGFGYSRNGINGPYGTAITMDGYIVGEYILAQSIVGAHIQAGTIDASKLRSDAIQVGFNELGDTLQLTPYYLNIYDDGIRIMGLGQNGMEFFQSNRRVGVIGSARWQTAPEKIGISMGLDDGAFVSFTLRNPSTGLYDILFGFCNDTSIYSLPGTQMGSALNLNGYPINITNGVKITSFSNGGGGLMGNGNEALYIGHSGQAYIALDQLQIYVSKDINMQGNTIKNVHIVEAQTGTTRGVSLEAEAVFGIDKLIQWIGEGEIKNGESEIYFPVALFGQIESFHVSITPLSDHPMYVEKKSHSFVVHGESGTFSYQVTAKKKPIENHQTQTIELNESTPTPMSINDIEKEKEE